MRRWLGFAALVALSLLITGTVHAGDSGRVHHDASATGERLPSTMHSRQREEVVIGADDRTRVADTSVFPYSAIAYLELENDSGHVYGSCTGTFIGPDALLTAGHCLWDTKEDDWGAAHIRVVPGKDADFEPFGSEYAEDWWVPDEYAVTGASVWDWGIIKMPNDLITLDTGWLGVAIATTEELLDSMFSPAIYGYPADKPDGTMWGVTRQKFVVVEEFRLTYDIDTAAGQSGSAIWSAAEGRFQGLIVGIHAQGGLFNSGSRIDQELVDDLQKACDVMGCTVDVVDVPPVPIPDDLPYRNFGVEVARD